MIKNQCNGSYSQAVIAGKNLEKNNSIDYKVDSFKNSYRL